MKNNWFRFWGIIAAAAAIISLSPYDVTAAVDGKVSNLKSTSHTLNTVDINSKNPIISMAWESAAYTDTTLYRYYYKFSTNSNDTIEDDTAPDVKWISAEATGTDSEDFGSVDKTAYYFYIRAVFTMNQQTTIDGVTYDAGEDFWGDLVKKGPYYIDNTAPQDPTISINSGDSETSSIYVTLTLASPGASWMKISNQSETLGTAEWETFNPTKSWTLSGNTGTKTVFIKCKDNAGNETTAKSDTIELVQGALVLTVPTTMVQLGNTLPFTVSGGTSPYTWAVTDERDEDGATALEEGSIATISSATETSAILTPQAAGTCKVLVRDSSGTSLEKTSSVITIEALTISPASITLTKGTAVNLRAESGTGPYTWTVESSDLGTFSSATTANTTFTAGDTSGNGTITVEDVNGITATAQVAVTSATMAITGGNGLDVTVGTQAANLEVTIYDDSGPDGYDVVFTITVDPTSEGYSKASFSADAESTTYTATTAGGGIASAPFYAGQGAGVYTISATCSQKSDETPVSVTNSPRTFTITGIAGTAANISYVSGNPGTGTPDTQLSNPFVVLVTDDYGNPVENVSVEFIVISGGGQIAGEATKKTDSTGKASAYYTPGSGENEVRAKLSEDNYVPFSFTTTVSKTFSLITTDTTNTNTIGFIFGNTGITTAHELGTAVGQCSQVSKWNAETQSYLSHRMQYPTLNNFSLNVGEAYFVTITEAHDFILSGQLPTTLSYNLITTSTTNTNAVGVPHSKQELLTAHQLGEDIGNCSQVSKWNAETQSYLSHRMQYPSLNNFSITWGEGYFITVTEETDWTW